MNQWEMPEDVFLQVPCLDERVLFTREGALVPQEEGTVRPDIETGSSGIYFDIGSSYSVKLPKPILPENFGEGSRVRIYRFSGFSDYAPQGVDFLSTNSFLLKRFIREDKYSPCFFVPVTYATQIQKRRGGKPPVPQLNALNGISCDYFNECAVLHLAAEAKDQSKAQAILQKYGIKKYLERYPKDEYPGVLDEFNRIRIRKLDRVVDYAKKVISEPHRYNPERLRQVIRCMHDLIYTGRYGLSVSSI